MNKHSNHDFSKRVAPQPQVRDNRVRALRMARLRAQIFTLLIETVLLLSAFLLAASIRHPGEMVVERGLELAVAFVPFYLLVSSYHGVYSLDALNRSRVGVVRIAEAFLVSIAVGLVTTFATKTTSDISRIMLVVAILIGFAFVTSMRLLIVRVLRHRFGARLTNVLVVSAGGPAISLAGATTIQAQDWAIEPNPEDPEMLDRFGRMARDMDRVIVSCPLEERLAWTFMLRGLNVCGEVVAHGLHDLGVLDLQREHNFTSLVVSSGSLGLRDRALKRMLDLALTVPMMVALLPLFIVVAIAIKLEDGGPVFFVQKRVGRSNCHFNVLKFRSMKVARLDRAGDLSASKDDIRVTRVGRFIRRTSIDELPQLLNVLQGEMSLVGPRPHALGSRAGGKLFWEIDPRYWHRHALKPGLTGLAQVRGFRGATDVEGDLTGRLQADLEYLADWTPWTDLVILAQTARVLVHDRAF